MSVQRYKATNGYGGDSDLIADDAGELVLHTGYAALEARCAGLELERDDSRKALAVAGEQAGKAEYERGALQGIVSGCMGILGMTQTAWDGTDIPRSEADLPRWVRDVADASYRKGQERDALQAKLAAAEEALRDLTTALRPMIGHAEWSMSYAKNNPGSNRESVQDDRDDYRKFLDAEKKADAILAGHAPATPQQAEPPKTTLLDQLETGPWPSFVEDVKALAGKTATKGEGDE